MGVNPRTFSGRGNDEGMRANLEADGEAERHAVHVVAEHVAHHRACARDDDRIPAAVELQSDTERCQVVEAEYAGAVAEVMRVRGFEHIAHRAVERGKACGGTPARPQAELLGRRRSLNGFRRTAEAA